MTDFKLFGLSHIMFLIFEVFMILLLCLNYKKIKKNTKLTTFLRYMFAAIHIVFEILYYFWAISSGNAIKDMLPLEFCSISVYLTIVFLIFNKEKIWQIIFPISIVNAALTCLLGTANGFDFPHMRFLQFFLNHGLLIISNLFGLLVLDFNMGFKEFKKSLLVFSSIALIVFVLNLILGTNYMYLYNPPRILSNWKYNMGLLYLFPLSILMVSLYSIPMYFLIYNTKKKSYKKLCSGNKKCKSMF